MPITVRPPHPQNIATTLPTVKMIVEVTPPTSERAWVRHGCWGLSGGALLNAASVPTAGQPLCLPDDHSAHLQTAAVPGGRCSCGCQGLAPHPGHRSVWAPASRGSAGILVPALTALLGPADDLPKKRPAQIYKPSNPDMLAYLDFSVSTTGMLAGVKVSCWPWALMGVFQGQAW